MRVFLLGGIAVEVSGDRVSVRGGRAASLLALLALDAGRFVSVDRCIEELWPGEPPANPRNALQARVSELRRILGRDRVESGPAGYRLTVPAESIDLWAARAAVERARRELAGGDAAAALRALGDVVPGEPLVGAGDGPEITAARVRAVELLVDVEECRAEALVTAGRDEDALPLLGRLSSDHPLRERTWALLITALYRSGRQGEALRAYQQARAVLAAELGVEPGPELRRLERAVLDHDDSLARVRSSPDIEPPAGPRDRSARLPVPPTPLVGRDEDVAAVEALVAEARVVTLTGPGGVGKTRLALAVGDRVAARRAGGAWFVDLAPLADATLVAQHTADAMGLGSATSDADRDPIASVVAALESRSGLVILDNCEHLVDAVAGFVSELTRRSAVPRVLATSREPLGVPGERQWPVPTLAVSPSGPLGPAPAVELFEHCAAAVRPDLRFDGAERALVGEVCERLDGLPLAIELAAARLRSLSVRELAERLDERFTLLRGGARTALPRQRTLEALVRWSWDLLDEPQRRALESLALLPAGVELTTAEELLDGLAVDASALDLLDQLVERSLVVVEQRPTGRTRYRLLESIRLFADARRLERSEPGTDDRALDWAVSFARRADEGVRSVEQPSWWERLDAEHDNLRSLLDLAIEHGDGDRAIAIAASLSWWWWLRGHRREGAARIASALSLAGGAPDDRRLARAGGALLAEHALAPDLVDRAIDEVIAEIDGAAPGVAARMAAIAAVVMSRTHRAGEAEGVLERGATRLGEDHVWERGVLELVRGNARLGHGDLDGAERAWRTAGSLLGELGDGWGRARSDHLLGVLAEARGDLDEATARYRSARSGPGQIDSLMAEGHLANVALLAGRFDEAEAGHRRVLARAGELGHPDLAAFAENGLGMVASGYGRHDEAIRHHTRALEYYRSIGAAGGVSFAAASLAAAEVEAGDVSAARLALEEAFSGGVAGRDPRALALIAEVAAGIALAEDDPERAARLLGAADQRRDGAGGAGRAAERGRVERLRGILDRRLGSAVRRSLERDGASLDDDRLTSLLL